MNFGENLRLLRKNSKMSQEALAEKIGVSRQSVSKWEVGSAYPEMTNITALCSIFHCNITDLINENIIDVDSFDEKTKEDIVKFKENQQNNMKRISKSIYIISKVCEIMVIIPTALAMLACIIFPLFANTFSIEEDKVKILNIETPYSIDNNILKIKDKEYHISTLTNIRDFINKHDNTFFRISAEYILLCATFLSAMSVIFLHYIYKLYKNIYNENTPFTIDNEKVIKKAVVVFLVQWGLTKITALIYSIIAKIDLGIEFNIKDIITLLIATSIVYIFKYGRMIQADSKAKIYGEIKE